LLLRFNTELLDIYRYYAHAEVDIAQPDFEPTVLPYTPLSPTSAPAGAVHPSASASAVSSRMNLAQLWLLVSDLGLIGHPALAHADLSLAGLDRLVLRRMLLGGSDAHANRLLLPALNSVHDPRNVLLHRDFLEALVRLAEDLFRTQPEQQGGEAQDELGADADAATEEEQDDDEDAVAPTVLYARALGSFDQILTGTSATGYPELSPRPSALALAELGVASPSAAAAGAARGLFNPAPVLSNPGTNPLSMAMSATFGATTSLPMIAGAPSPQSTVSQRLKRFLVEFVLPRAKTRSKHAFNAMGLSAAGGSFGHGAAQHGPTLISQPLFRLPSIVMLVKKYQKDIYTRVFVPHSTQHPALPTAATAASASSTSLVSTLPPLSDRTMSLSSLLRVLQLHPGALCPYFTLHHVLDILFCPSARGHAGERIFQALDLELLFEELLDTLVRVALYRGKVLSAAAGSVAREQEALERIRSERKEAAEAEARRVAAVEAAAAEAAAAVAAALAAEADNKPGKGGKPAAAAAKTGSGPSSAAPSKPASAGKKAAPAGTGAAAASAASGGAAAAKARQVTPKGSRAPSAGKSAAPSSRPGSLKKDTAGGKASKPGSAKKKTGGTLRPSSGAGTGAGAAFASSSSAAGAGGYSSRGGGDSASPYGSAPNSSRAGLGGGESGS
jgi:hypothetical protein